MVVGCTSRRERNFRGSGGRLRQRRMRTSRLRGLSSDKILAHFFQTFGANAFDCQQIVYALECAICFAHLQNFLRIDRPDPRNLLQFF